MYELKDQEMIFVFTGPNGAGRRTVAEMSGTTLGIKQVLSYTTRPPRPGEVDGEDYHFISGEAFIEADRRQEFMEVIEIDGFMYGIKDSDLAEMIQAGNAIYVVLNRYGAEMLKQLYGKNVVRISIYADRETILARQRDRGDSALMIERYMSHYDEEMAYRSECEHAFENIDSAHTMFDLTKILDGYLNRNLLDLD
ncbi:guanylate kinase [Paenibacillus thalictri]|uniref:Guanylate kinase n=1 Tax=Paenibacillus thalictri TaxID=2527873 RepID=A0A4Q9DH96_9BACL|nr:guanylate kinase [Paenibacillus thalictri]TBL71209.1 guanylate kinase [Paenibacillus thalictri]